MRYLRKDQGQAVVELVLVLPLVLTMVFAIVEFGFALNTYLTVNTAAAEGARYGALAAPPGDGTCGTNTVRGRALHTSPGTLECSDITVSYPGGPGSAGRGDEVVVRISHTYDAITPLGAVLTLLGEFGFPDEFTLNACSSGRLEQAPSPPVSRGGSSC